MSTTVAAVVLALVGVAAVVAVAWVFYRIGRAEDREREREQAEAARRAEPEDGDGDGDEHRVARERRRPLPPRRP
jgi:type II secretory pathway pseudopilin PulG